jgi:hypothetical protein
LIALDELIEALTRLPALAEVETENLYDIERKAFSILGASGYRKTALIVVAMLFDRLARKLEAEEPGPGQSYATICDKTLEVLSVNDWRNGAQRLEEVVDMCWITKLLH